MSDKSLSSKTGIIIFGNITHSLIMLIIPIFLTRLLSKTDFGTYRQIFLIFHIGLAIFVFGIPKSIYYFIPRLTSHKQSTYIFQSIAVLLIIGIIIALLIIVFATPIALFLSNPLLKDYLTIISLYIIFVLPLECFVPIMICFEKYKIAALQRIVFDLVFFSAILMPVMFGKGFAGIIIAILMSAPINFLFGLYLIWRELKFRRFSFDLSLLKSQMLYSSPIGLSSILLVLMTELDKIMVSYFFTPAIFAIYAIGAREVPFVNNILLSISGVIQPRLVEFYSKNELENFISLCHRAARKTAIVIFPIFIFCFVIADLLITTLFTEKYIESSLFFRIYLFTLLIRFISLGPILLAMGFSKDVMFSSAISLICNVIFTIILIKTIGIMGAALATVLANYINYSFLFFRIKKRILSSKISLLPWDQIFRILSIATLSGIILYPFMTFLKPSFVFLFLVTIIYFGIYSILSIITRTIRRDELVQIKDLFMLNRGKKTFY